MGDGDNNDKSAVVKAKFSHACFCNYTNDWSYNEVHDCVCFSRVNQVFRAAAVRGDPTVNQ